MKTFKQFINESIGNKSVDRLYTILKQVNINPQSEYKTAPIGGGKVSDDLFVYWNKWDEPEKIVGVRFTRTRFPNEKNANFEPLSLIGIEPSWKMRHNKFNITHNSMINAVREYISSIKV